jgi:hypothetical protein
VTPDALETIFWYVGLGLEFVLLGLLLRNGTYRSIPFFFAYVLWGALDDIVSLFLTSSTASEGYLQHYVLAMTLDALFELAVWVELGRAVLRHNRAKPPQPALALLLFALAAVLVWSMAQMSLWHSGVTLLRMLFVYLRQAHVIMMVAVLLTFVWLSGILGLRWAERELQIATGFGIYFMVSLTVYVLHTHVDFEPLSRRLDQIEVASHLGALLYWIISFLQFDEKPQNFLVRA